MEKTEKNITFYSKKLYKDEYPESIDEQVKVMIDYAKIVSAYYHHSSYNDVEVKFIDQLFFTKIEVLVKHKYNPNLGCLYKLSVSYDHSHIMIQTDDDFKSLTCILHNMFNRNERIVRCDSFEFEIYLNDDASESEFAYADELSEKINSKWVNNIYSLADTCIV